MEEEEEKDGEEGAVRETGAQPPVRLYPELDTSVEVWSDFLRLHLHPKSLLMIPGHFHYEYAMMTKIVV